MLIISLGNVILLTLAGIIGTFVGGGMCFLWLAAMSRGQRPDPTILVFGLIMFGVWFPLLSRMLARIRKTWRAL